MATQALTRTRALVLSLAVSILVGGSDMALAGNQPQFIVQFEVRSPSIKQSLPDPTRAADIQALELSLSSYLANKIRPLLGFAAWNPTEDTSKRVLGRLIARLVDEPGAEIPQIRVEWFSKHGNEPEVELGWEFVQVVERNDANAQLGNREIVEQLTKAGFDKTPGNILKQNLLDTFMSRIPLAGSVSANDTDQLVELPMQRDELPLGLKSVMSVKFNKTAPEAKEGEITLTRFGQTGSGKLRASVDGAVLNSRTLALTNNWHPEFRTLFQGATVRCFLTDYEPDGALSERLVANPQ
ncbi:MAG TPA: hypothetical protein VJM12_16630 [Pyrinomonadaceae bacterium]|nr:hypothetical protein [Pyrinomonadaceae bacterium]